MRITLLALSLVTVSITTMARADADLVRAELEWERAEGAAQCIDEASLASRVEARLERPVFVGEGGDVRVIGSVASRERGGFRVELALEVEGQVVGTRDLVSTRPECSAIEESLALMLALLVDVTRQDIEVILPDDEPELPSASSELRGGARVQASIGSGILPNFAAAFEIVAWLSPVPLLSIEVEGSLSLDSERAVADGARMVANLRGGGLGVCLDGRPIEWLELGGCGRFSVGLLSAIGRGFEEEGAGELVWVAAGAGGRARFFPVSSVEIYLGADFFVPIVRDRFVADLGERVIVHTLDPIAIRGTLGVGFALP